MIFPFLVKLTSDIDEKECLFLLKIKTLLVALCFSIMGLGTFTTNVSAHDSVHFQMNEAEYQSLIEQGYSKKDIFRAKGIAHLAKKDIGDVLDHYQKSGSWEKTAAHFGIDVKKLKAKHKKMKAKHEKMKKFYMENKEEIFAYIAGYSAISQEELRKIQVENSLKTHHLMKAAVIAKLSNSALVDVVNEHKAGKKFYEIAQNRNVKKAEFRKELKRIHSKIKESINS